MIDAEFAFEACLRSLLTRQLQNQRMNAELNLINVRRFQIVLIAKLDAGIDCRVDNNTAGERLVGIETKLPGLTQSFGNLGVVALRTDHVGPAGLRFEPLL